jgi:hypothetical protein
MSPPEDPIKISSKSNIDKTALKAKEMDLRAGWLGKFFGTEGNAAFNALGLALLILVLLIPVVCIFQTRIEPKEYLHFAFPTIGTMAGYFFGRYSSK